jgi:hypothetical protein
MGYGWDHHHHQQQQQQREWGIDPAALAALPAPAATVGSPMARAAPQQQQQQQKKDLRGLTLFEVMARVVEGDAEAAQIVQVSVYRWHLGAQMPAYIACKKARVFPVLHPRCVMQART